MTTLNPVERAASLGGAVAGAPLRLVSGLAAPSRVGMARNVRRAIGIREEPAPMATDPDEAYLPPGGMARLVHADLPTMLIGGVERAAAPDAASTGHGRCRRAFRLQGGPARPAAADRHLRGHDDLRHHRPGGGGHRAGAPGAPSRQGTAPDGRPYAADDPELVTFIHVAEVSSFLASSRRYGPRPLGPEQCDRYYEEVAPVALALGATWAPRSVAEVESYLLRVRPELYAGPQAREARDWLLRDVARRPGERAVYSLVLASAIGILPAWARRELRLSLAGPIDLLVDTAAVGPLTRGLSAAVRWMVTPPA